MEKKPGNAWDRFNTLYLILTIIGLILGFVLALVSH